jgi:hypothetical protein
MNLSVSYLTILYRLLGLCSIDLQWQCCYEYLFIFMWLSNLDIETKGYKKSVMATEMKFMTRATGYSLLDHKINEDVLELRQIDPVGKKLVQYR